jgi:cephalosporin hydroxylase
MEVKRLEIDLTRGEVTVEPGTAEARTHALGSAEGFAAVSQAWLRAGWDAKHVYSFTWLGRPMIQLPEDMLRLQEVIVSVRPDVIVETGIAHGGSTVFHASLCRLMNHGRVVAVDVEIRPHNRAALEAHPLSPLYTLIEGSSIDPRTISRVRSEIKDGESVMVLLDSAHGKAHVLAELAAYAPLVTPGSFIVAMDGIMGEVAGAPRTGPEWSWDNPKEAAAEFARAHPEFERATPPFAFNEGAVDRPVTYWPGGWLRRLR